MRLFMRSSTLLQCAFVITIACCEIAFGEGFFSFTMSANGTIYSISTSQPTVLAVSSSSMAATVQIPLFVFAQNLALSPDGSVLFMSVDGTCVVSLCNVQQTSAPRQELVAGQPAGRLLQPGLFQMDGPGEFCSCFVL